ncbi:VOC family protein [Caballeronia sp. 15711]|uniref:VOC family protein n=1 Tax=Caballeronia sp. 15711 TaxID=3391029 RepID=UPI0039E5E09F
MYGDDLAYVALIVEDVEVAAQSWEKDFGLARSEHRAGNGGGSVPMFSVGHSAIALFAQGDPYVGGETRTGVHHIALAVDDVESAKKTVQERGIAAETGRIESSLDGGGRFQLSARETVGVKTWLTNRVDRPVGKPDFVNRIDHLGVVGTDNNLSLETYCKKLGCRFLGEQTDTEIQIAVEHFVFKDGDGKVNTVVHNRPAQFIAAVHDLFIGVGDCELEIIQTLPTQAQARASGNQAGDTRQDHGAVARFLETRGPGLHHIAFRVDEIDARLEKLRAGGYRLIDQRGRPGARGSRIGFIHPKSTGGVLVHLVDRLDTL